MPWREFQFGIVVKQLIRSGIDVRTFFGMTYVPIRAIVLNVQEFV